MKFRANLPIPPRDHLTEFGGGATLDYENVQSGGGFDSHLGTHPLSRSAQLVVDPRRRLVAVKFGKKLTVADIERYSRHLQSNPSFQPNYSEIVDLSEVEELDLQADEFLRLADEIDPFSSEAKRAFVVRNSVQNHAARMHKVLRT